MPSSLLCVLLLVALTASRASAQPDPLMNPDDQVPPPVHPEDAPPPPSPPSPPSQPPPSPPPPAPPVQPVATIATPPAPKPHKTVCTQGQPERCDSVFLLEAGYRGGTARTLTFDVGVLVHHGSRNAFGVTIGYLGFERTVSAPTPYTDINFLGAYKARYRRYLGGEGAAFDLGIGGGRYGASGELAIGYRDIIAVSAGVNSVPTRDGNDVAANVGVRLGATGIVYALYGLLALAGGR